MKIKTKYWGIAYAFVVGLAVLANQFGFLPQLKGDFASIRNPELKLEELRINCAYEEQSRLFTLNIPRVFRGNVHVVDPNDSRSFPGYSKQPSLQDAVNVAMNGDKIYLCPGYHTAETDIRNKILYIGGLMNPEDTILTGYNKRPGIIVSESRLQLENFQIEDTFVFQRPGAALSATDSDIDVNEVNFIGNRAVNGESAGGIYYNNSKIRKALSIQDSYFYDNESGERGGAILHENGDILLLDSIFEENKAASEGGAIAIIHADTSVGTYSIENTDFIANSSTDGGGAIFGWSSTHITDPFILNLKENEYIKNISAWAGGIEWRGTVIESDGLYSENTGAEGTSALYVRDEANLDNVTLKDNVSHRQKGTVFLESTEGTSILQNMLFERNIGPAVVADGYDPDQVQSEVYVKDSVFMDNGGSAINYGAAIEAESVSLISIENSTFLRNTAKHGGAVHTDDCIHVSIEESIFQNNLASLNGGAIFFENGEDYVTTFELNENEFTGNGVSGFGEGGAMYISENANYGVPSLVMTYNTFTNNSATHTGGVYSYGMDAYIEGNTFVGNTSIASSGGALNLGGVDTEIQHEIVNNTFSENRAHVYGGALYLSDDTQAWVDSNTFYDNSANEAAGALYVDSQEKVELINNIFELNTASSYGTCWFVFPVIVSEGYNITTDADSCELDHETDVETTASIVDPTLMNNGGLTHTHAIHNASPANGTGTCSQSIDQRGVTRSIDCDRGAYED